MSTPQTYNTQTVYSFAEDYFQRTISTEVKIEKIDGQIRETDRHKRSICAEVDSRIKNLQKVKFSISDRLSSYKGFRFETSAYSAGELQMKNSINVKTRPQVNTDMKATKMGRTKVEKCHQEILSTEKLVHKLKQGSVVGQGKVKAQNDELGKIRRTRNHISEKLRGIKEEIQGCTHEKQEESNRFTNLKAQYEELKTSVSGFQIVHEQKQEELSEIMSRKAESSLAVSDIDRLIEKCEKERALKIEGLRSIFKRIDEREAENSDHLAEMIAEREKRRKECSLAEEHQKSKRNELEKQTSGKMSIGIQCEHIAGQIGEKEANNLKLSERSETLKKQVNILRSEALEWETARLTLSNELEAMKKKNQSSFGDALKNNRTMEATAVEASALKKEREEKANALSVVKTELEELMMMDEESLEEPGFVDMEKESNSDVQSDPEVVQLFAAIHAQKKLHVEQENAWAKVAKSMETRIAERSEEDLKKWDVIIVKSHNEEMEKLKRNAEITPYQTPRNEVPDPLADDYFGQLDGTGLSPLLAKGEKEVVEKDPDGEDEEKVDKPDELDRLLSFDQDVNFFEEAATMNKRRKLNNGEKEVINTPIMEKRNPPEKKDTPLSVSASDTDDDEFNFEGIFGSPLGAIAKTQVSPVKTPDFLKKKTPVAFTPPTSKDDGNDADDEDEVDKFVTPRTKKKRPKRRSKKISKIPGKPKKTRRRSTRKKSRKSKKKGEGSKRKRKRKVVKKKRTETKVTESQGDDLSVFDF